MRYLSKNEVADRLRFVESQTVFVLETTAKVNTANDFLMSQNEWYCSIPPVCVCRVLVRPSVR